MFQVKSVPIQPFKPVCGRRVNWWAVRPSGPGVAGMRNQLVNCEGGPSEESSFEDKFRCSVEFWRAWLLPKQRRPRALQEITIMLQLTFRQTAEGMRLIPESLYPLLALYAVFRDEPRAAAVRRVTVAVTRYHWLLWRPLMAPHEKAIKLPLESIVGDVEDPLYGLQEELRDEYVRKTPLIDGCYWVLPTCLQAVLRNFTYWVGIAATPRLLTWFGSSLEELRQGFIV